MLLIKKDTSVRRQPQRILRTAGNRSLCMASFAGLLSCVQRSRGFIRQWSTFDCLIASLNRRLLTLVGWVVSFEDALLSPEPNPIMTQILSRFVLNLRPGTRNLRYAHL